MVSVSSASIGVENRIENNVQERLLCLPSALFEILGRIRQAGGRAWLCGGAVRDLYQARVPRDLDLAMTLRPQDAIRVLPECWLLPDQSGLEFGCIRLEVGGQCLEITTLREDSSYRDGRKPEAVEFVEDPLRDHVRRDFAVNGMYLDPLEGTVIDPSGGLVDLEMGRLRTIGEPRRRFEEDHLRMIRAIRFSVQCDLVMDQQCWNALVTSAGLTSSLSGPRILEELEGIFCSRGRARGLMLLVQSGLAAIHLPMIPPLASVPQPPQYHPEGDVLRHTALVLASLPDPVSADLAWAAVFHDTGKKDCFELAEDRIRFHDHDRLGTSIAELWLRQHGASRGLLENVMALIRDHIRIASFPGFRPARQRNFLEEGLLWKHLTFHRADCLASHRILDVYEQIRCQKALLPPGSLQPLLRGRDLMEIGIQAGPAMGTLLAAIQEERAAGRLASRDDALKYALRWRDDRSG